MCEAGGGGEMPIYEGGQCGQNQFYSSEIYTVPRHSIQSQLFSFFGGAAL